MTSTLHPSPRADRVAVRRTDSSARAFTDELRTRIVDGTYLSGEPLPKVRYFTIDRKHSATTVVGALRNLHAEGLVHKRGKRWFAGRVAREVPGTARRSAENPVALFIVLNEAYWATMFRHSFTAPFVAALTGELVKHRVSLGIASIHSPHNELNALPTGEEEIRQFIRSLGNRYQGSLVTFFPDEMLAEWVALVARFGKPVINFNSTNQSCGVTRRSLGLRKGAYCNLHLDDSSAVQLALGHLAERGHRVIGVPMRTVEGYEWMSRRVDEIRKCAERHFPAMRIVTVEQTEPWWDGPAGFSVDDFVNMAGMSTDRSVPATVPLPAGVRKALMDTTPSLMSLVRYKNLTAILALNNELARKYYCWLKVAGIEVPERMSLISFDNTPESVAFPITTVDFGFARLGYLAAHILIGDIPVKADIEGSVPGPCELVDRGSVRNH